jgi:hypothetical protein
VFSFGSGNDYISDNGRFNTLAFTDGIMPENLIVDTSGSYDVVIENTIIGETVTVSYFRRYAENRNFVLEFYDGRTAAVSGNYSELIYDELPTVEFANESEPELQSETAADAPDTISVGVDLLNSIYNDSAFENGGDAADVSSPID